MCALLDADIYLINFMHSFGFEIFLYWINVC